MLVAKRKLKIKIVKKLLYKNLCFFIVSGKQKFLSEFFGKNSVLHISFFKWLLNNEFLGKYCFSFVCIFNSKNFLKYYNLLSEKRILIHQICLNNYFLNFYGFMDHIKNYQWYIDILNVFLINFYLLIFIIINLLLYVISFFYLLLQQKC